MHSRGSECGCIALVAVDELVGVERSRHGINYASSANWEQDQYLSGPMRRRQGLTVIEMDIVWRSPEVSSGPAGVSTVVPRLHCAAMRQNGVRCDGSSDRRREELAQRRFGTRHSCEVSEETGSRWSQTLESSRERERDLQGENIPVPVSEILV